MIKICERCGKMKEMMSWETLCYQCMIETDLEKTQEEIRKGEEDVCTASSDYVICPYCGSAFDTCYDYEDFPELYKEGIYDIKCPECEKNFELETTVSYYYETKKVSE